jgi:hypothetical protein
MIKLTWVDVGLATEPGRYDSRNGLIEVTSNDLWVWQKYPNAAFVVMQSSPFSGVTISRLGTFELREDWNVPRNERGIEPYETDDEDINGSREPQMRSIAPPIPDGSDLVPLARHPVSEVPADKAAEETAIETVEETKNDIRDPVEQVSDLRKRIDAWITGSDQTS